MHLYGISPKNAFILELSCTFMVLFVGVTVAFDKRRCKELGLQMVYVWYTGRGNGTRIFCVHVCNGKSWCGLEPCKVLRAIITERRPIMVWPLGILGGTFCCLYCLLWIHSDLACMDVMMRGDDELDVLQIGFLLENWFS